MNYISHPAACTCDLCADSKARYGVNGERHPLGAPRLPVPSPVTKMYYDAVDERIVIFREDGSVERLTAVQVRQRALWRDGKPQVAEVLGVREMPVK